MKRKFLTLAITALMLPVPLAAQEEDMEMTEMSDGGDDDTETLGLLAYLGLSAAEGNTTVNEGAGKIEGQMLGAAMAWEAAKTIVTAKNVKNQSHVYLLPGSSKLNVGAYFQVKERLSNLSDEYEQFKVSSRQSGCVPGGARSAGKKDGKDDPKPFTFKASDALGLLKTDTALSPIEVTVSENLMTNALLAHAPKTSNWKLTEEIAFPDNNSALQSKAEKLKVSLRIYMRGDCGNGSKIKPEDKKKIVAAATTLFGQVADLSKSKDGQYSPLMQARLASSIVASDIGEIRTLRYEVSSVGGTLVNSSNIWTTIGIPGVTIRGGLVATYRLSNPRDGTSNAQGVVICRAPMKSLKSITAKGFGAKNIECSLQ